MLGRLRHQLLATAAAATLLGGLLALGAARPASGAVPATIPLKLTNNSGRGDAVYVYNLGTNLATGQQGWADANGTFHAWPAGGN
ncbi:sugar hydrolase, partial [Streptomyces sp. S3(2020)]|uniref:beta-1,3-glucanase family protein n=1 Tax=Streptomyces sp. S3(2020) TaxID=2732044 RepID=UPI00179387B4|nr:sugar hydrolase [Streptomyces sp. S3(2020)]